MDKGTFRKQQIAKLAAFAKSGEKKREDAVLTRKALRLPQLREANDIGVTYSLASEVDTSSLIAQLWEAGKGVWLAKSNPDKSMDFVRYEPSTVLQKSKFGVMEVADRSAAVKNDLDLLIVPGLAFSAGDHKRLGFGGGYYDRFLAKYQPQTVSLVNSAMLYPEAVWGAEAFDYPVDCLLTVKAADQERDR